MWTRGDLDPWAPLYLLLLLTWKHICKHFSNYIFSTFHWLNLIWKVTEKLKPFHTIVWWFIVDPATWIFNRPLDFILVILLCVLGQFPKGLLNFHLENWWDFPVISTGHCIRSDLCAFYMEFDQFLHKWRRLEAKSSMKQRTQPNSSHLQQEQPVCHSFPAFPTQPGQWARSSGPVIHKALQQPSPAVT